MNAKGQGDARIARKGGQDAACRVRGDEADGRGGTTLVAVYGTLMRGERNERWRRGVPTVAEGTVAGRLYDTGWGFPNLVLDTMESGAAEPVRVEVLATDAAGLAQMDVLEGCPDLYERVPVAVAGDDGQVYEAQVYTMRDERRSNAERRIRGGGGAAADWREWRRARND